MTQVVAGHGSEIVKNMMLVGADHVNMRLVGAAHVTGTWGSTDYNTTSTNDPSGMETTENEWGKDTLYLESVLGWSQHAVGKLLIVLKLV